MTETAVADLSPGTVLVARSTGWHYRVRAADSEANRAVLCGLRGSLAVGYGDLQRGIANGRIRVQG